MPRKRNESSHQKVYRLWWDYLKLSEDYREFCEWMVRRSKNPSIPIPKRSNWFELWESYKLFGNIHVDSFEKWWESNGGKLGRAEEMEGIFPGAIEDYTDFMMFDMDGVTREYQLRKEREPSIEEFKKAFLEKLKVPIPRFYFMVSLLGDYEYEDLGRLFIRKLKEMNKKRLESAKKRAEEDWESVKKKLPFPPVEAKADKYLTWVGRWRYPTTRLRLDGVERYLKVFNLFANRLAWRQIAKEVYPKYEYVDTRGKLAFPDSIKRAVYQDRENAEKIISNAEKGIFPGQYSVRPEKLDQKHSS